MRKNPYQLFMIEVVLFLCMAGIIMRLYAVSHGTQAAEAGIRQGKYHLHIQLSSGTVYDRNMIPLNQSEEAVYAVVTPTPDAVASVYAKIADRDALKEHLQKKAPFLCRLTGMPAANENVILLRGTEKPAGTLPAQHLLGYQQNGKAVAGLEAAYSEWLGACSTSADLTFSVDANGGVLAGAEQSNLITGAQGGGIVTTLQAEIQQIAEDALAQAERAGAVVVMNCRTGELAACASTPVYDPDHLAEALERDDAPFVNRALSAYSVGSVFKLVTAAAALENGFNPRYMFSCSGEITVRGQRFRCHKRDGHGLLNMQQALIQSCNPYFISLSRLLTPEMMHDTAEAFGFGTETVLANELCGAAGYLPSVKELQIEAEKANMSFGQGKLLATPVQIAAMTACIANNGIYSPPILIRGLTADGKKLIPSEAEAQHRAVSEKTAKYLRRMMTAVIGQSKTTKGKPSNVRAAGKTSTAQTGQFDENGDEYCHAWMTGFFPVSQPEYAVTVLIEKGGSGNDAAAPVFRSVIEQITDLQS